MPTLDFQVGESADDCFVRWDGSAWAIDITRIYQQVGYATAAYQRMGGGMRFTGVTIPAGAVITTAYLTFRCNYDNAGTAVKSRISAEQSANAAQFSTIEDYQGRTKTSAVVDWDNIPAWTSGNDYDSVDIKDIIQELVDDYGGLSGTNIVIFWDDHDDRSTHAANCYRTASSRDDSATYAPKLHIEYYTAVTEKTSSDTGSGADAYVSLETPEARLSSDIGSGLEGTPLSSASLAGNESGAGTEVSQLFNDLFQELYATELGEGSDLLSTKIEMPTKGGGMKLWT